MLSPVTRSSAVLVACPEALVALTEYLPLCVTLTAGICRTARPSLNEIWMPGRAAAERTWPSRNQLTSGTGEPAEGPKLESAEETKTFVLPLADWASCLAALQGSRFVGGVCTCSIQRYD